MAAPLASRFLAVAIALSCATVTVTAEAQPAATAPRRTVSVSIRGAGEDNTRVLSATILELLSRLQLTMIDSSGSSTASPLLASVDIDLAAAGGARVVVRSGRGVTVLDRTVRDPNAAIQREQIAHAVRGAAEAELLADEDRVAGRAPETAAPPPPRPPPPPEPKPAEPEPPPVAEAPPPEPERTTTETKIERVASTASAGAIALDLSTFLGGGPVASDAGPVMRVGGAAAIAYRRGVRPSLALSAMYAFPFEAGTSTLSSRTKLVSARAMAAIEVLRGGWFAVDVGGGGGFDVLDVQPTSTVLPASALREPTTKIDPIIAAATTARFAVASDVMLTVAIVGDVDLVTRHYVFDNRGQRGDILEPWTVRPMLLAGLSFTAFGEVPFRPKSGR